MKLAVSEVFYSLQGEGVTTGVPAVFLRLSGCNLMCGGMGTQFDKELHNGATWRCDTVEVWMKGSSKDFETILDEECVTALQNGAHLVVTGGEPLMQEKALIEYFKWLSSNVHNSIFIEVETNGTVAPSPEFCQWVRQFNCSPKLSNSGNAKEARLKPEALKALQSQRYSLPLLEVYFKFVISRDEDWQEIVEDFLPYISKRSIILMPAGEDQELLKQSRNTVAELAKKHYLRFSTRLHIDIWNKKTGV